MDDCLFRKDRPEGQVGGIVLYVRGQLKCIKLQVEMDDDEVESLWARNKGQANTSDTIVDVYYKTCYQEEEADEVSYKQLEAALQSWALCYGFRIMWDFNHPGMYWISNMARHARSRMFPQCIESNVLMQVVEEPMRRFVLLDLAPLTREFWLGM